MGELGEHLKPFLKIDECCIACEWCKFNCPVTGCFTFETIIAEFHPELCIECSRCIFVCPVDAILPLRQARPKHLPPLETFRHA